MIGLNEPEKRFRRAISSYLNQIGVKVQLIASLVEHDCSMISVAESMGLQVVLNKSPSIYGQLNAGTPLVTGDWYSMASSHDTVMPDKYRHEIEMCLSKKKKICYSDMYYVDSDLNILSVGKNSLYSYSRHIVGNIIPDNATISMDIFRKYVPFKEEFGNDAYYDFWLRIAEGEGNIFVHNPIPEDKYIIESSSRHIRRKKDPKIFLQHQLMRKKMLASHGINYKIKKGKTR